MTLDGPSKIEISDDQLEALRTTYSDLASETEEMIHDFFSPFEIMHDENIFKGASARAYTEFCTLIHQYTSVRYDMALSEFKKAAEEFTDKINEVEDYNG